MNNSKPRTYIERTAKKKQRQKELSISANLLTKDVLESVTSRSTYFKHIAKRLELPQTDEVLNTIRALIIGYGINTSGIVDFEVVPEVSDEPNELAE